MIRLALTVLAGALALFLAQATFAFMAPPGPRPGPADLPAVVLSNLLTATMLLVLARRMTAEPARRALILWVVWGGIQVDSFAELFLFDIGIPRTQTAWLIVFSLVVAAVAATVVGWATRPRAHPTPSGALRGRPAWLALAPPLYIVCYFTAGMLVWPFIAAYYQSRPMPAPGAVVALQVVRGLGFGAIVLLIVQACDGGRVERAAVAGLTLAVLGGVAPLVMPNPLMPVTIRMAHLLEVVPSIFTFGAVLAWALTRPAALAAPTGTLAAQP
jgi:hypothetical protein